MPFATGSCIEEARKSILRERLGVARARTPASTGPVYYNATTSMYRVTWRQDAVRLELPDQLPRPFFDTDAGRA